MAQAKILRSMKSLGIPAFALLFGLTIASQASGAVFSLDDNANLISEPGLGCGPSNPIVGGADTALTGDDRCFEWTPGDGFTEGVIRAVDVLSVSESDIAFSIGDALWETNNLDVLVFTLDVTTNEIDGIGVAVPDAIPLLGNPVGVGWLNPVGGTQVPNGGPNANGLDLPGFTGRADIHFGPAGGVNDQVEAGETTPILFVTFSPQGNVTNGSLANFMLSNGAGDQNFLVQIAPEPGTALLLGLGLTALGASRRRRTGR